MMRFLQKDNRVVKAFFIVIIGAATVSMVVYLIPGLTPRKSFCRKRIMNLPTTLYARSSEFPLKPRGRFKCGDHSGRRNSRAILNWRDSL